MRHYDLSPLYRSTVGFDRLFSMLDQASNADAAAGYPPYNIERTSLPIASPSPSPASPRAISRSNPARTR